ncbi:MAG: questin oxidase family protein [Pseudomonadales bacterium]
MLHKSPREQIRQHHEHFGHLYHGGLSDHGPMSCLALSSLGATDERTARYYRTYCERLSPLEDGPYRVQLQRFLDELSRSGIQAVLKQYLPVLISGWVRDAYHPLIRIAYGFEFDIAEEVAAGLAYLSVCGADPRIEELAANAKEGDDPAGLFRRAQSWDLDFKGASTFAERAERVVAQPVFVESAQQYHSTLRVVSRCALEVFASTHNFFALHLVTSAHAFRLLHGFAGPHADAIFTLGVLAGYAAVEAPAFEPLAEPDTDGQEITAARLLDACSDNEHDYKLAYSAWRQAHHWNDSVYLAVAYHYLQQR